MYNSELSFAGYDFLNNLISQWASEQISENKQTLISCLIQIFMQGSEKFYVQKILDVTFDLE